MPRNMSDRLTTDHSSLAQAHENMSVGSPSQAAFEKWTGEDSLDDFNLGIEFDNLDHRTSVDFHFQDTDESRTGNKPAKLEIGVS